MQMKIIIEKRVDVTAMSGGSEDEDNAAITTQVPSTKSITGNKSTVLTLMCPQ